jgi:hypothetical protein
MELAEGMLFVELAKAGDDWLWRSDRIGNKPELGFGCLGKFVVERVKGRMESTGYEAMSLLCVIHFSWTMIVARVAWSLTPSFFWTQGIWGNFLCGVGVTAMVHAVWRLECVWTSVVTAAST